MIRRTINGAISAVCLACVGYVVFFVPVGRRTLFEHFARIWATAPAQELQADATTTAEAWSRHVASEIDHATHDAGVDVDGGISSAP